MTQTITVIIILLLAVSFAAARLYRFLTGSRDSGCDPEQCTSCPYSARPGDCRPAPEKKSKKQ
jgi:hypothetical protein